MQLAKLSIACFLLLIVPVSFAYDLNLSIITPSVLQVGNMTSLFKVTNLNYTTGQLEQINASVIYDILYVNGTCFSNKCNRTLQANSFKIYKIIGSWTPSEFGNYTICGNITNSTANDTNLQNNYACKNVSVQQTQSNNTNNSTGNCDLEVSINVTDIIYNYNDEINYKLKVEDLNCQNIKHNYSINYWIEDLFSSYLKEPHISTYEIQCQDTSSHQKKAPEICGSEIYYIKAQITDARCNDTNSSNNFAQQMIVVKGIDPDSSSCKSSTSGGQESSSTVTQKSNLDIKIIEAPENATQGEEIKIKINVTNNYDSAKTIEVYSYIYKGNYLITEGGWTGNQQEINLNKDETKTIELTNKIKENATLGTYTLKVRAKIGEEKADKTQSIEILEGKTIIQEKNQEVKPNKHISTVINYKNITHHLVIGDVIWSAKLNKSLDFAMLVFIAALVVLSVTLIISLWRR